jgi:hypothetical protein
VAEGTTTIEEVLRVTVVDASKSKES